ncbi:MAG TPA: hypothetical protein ENN09_05905 [Planctomycetes bacterium]|nr:hypothetical protein [Planctomycetota bacterium]
MQDRRPKHDPAIERVEVVRADSPPSPEARANLDSLLSRWLVRAYLRKHGRKPEVPACRANGAGRKETV